MNVYTVWCEDGDEFFTNRDEAMARAREMAKTPDWGDVEVQRHELVPLTKKSLLQILRTQGGCWSAGHETIAVIRPPA